MRSTSAGVLLILVGTGVAALAGQKIPLADLPKHAIEQSQLTVSGTPAFHLKAKVFEKTDRHNDSHDAEIAENWASPDKWRRTVKAGSFSEVLIANGNKITEQLEGDYYPNWLRTIVDGIFDPGAALLGVDLTKSGDTARTRVIPLGYVEAADLDGPEVCRRFQFLASASHVTNPIFSTYCFSKGLLQSIGVPGYDLSYSNYKKFADKQVARTLGEYIEPGTELEADIEELIELPPADDALFASRQDSAPLRTVAVKEDTVRNMVLSAPDIRWPPMRSGINPGRLSIYICIDREGHVRETYPLNSDNPNMTAAARQQVMKWSFRPASNKGEPVQVESILTFEFQALAFPKKK